MKFFKFVILFFLIAFFSSFESDQNLKSKFFKYSQTDTTIYAIINFRPYQTSLFRNAQPASLNLGEIEELEKVLNKCVEEYNLKGKAEFDSVTKLHPGTNIDVKNFIIVLSRYKRQYIPVLNERGEKEVWVNCFCRSQNRDWRTEIVSVRDGGNCYFQLKINLTSKKFYNLIINGDV